MSQWTHVNCSIRYDMVPLPGAIDELTPDLGRTARYDDDDTSCDVPCGSEGSLQYITHVYDNGLPWMIAAIWGDLRDYDDVDEIVAYLERITKDKMVRSGVALIEVGSISERTYIYRSDGWELVSEKGKEDL